jgi:hypothetical protein
MICKQSTLFIDDKKRKHRCSAITGISSLNLQVGKEDVVDLFNKKYNLENPFGNKRHLQ